MSLEQPDEHKRSLRPSNLTLSIGAIVSICGLLTTWVTQYNALQGDIASLKRGEIYQERTNTEARQDRIAIRAEQREGQERINDKLDKISDRLSQWRK